MGFLLPAALGFAAIIPGIVALYFLKLRRREREVSSTWLWRPVLRDRQANSLWQKLRVSLLLLVQLLAALALILSTARPFLLVKAASAGTTVLLLDATGAMQATDVPGGRFGAAKAQAQELVSQMPATGRMSLIALTHSPEILVANSTDKGALRAAIEGTQATAGDGDLAQAMALAYSLLSGQVDGQIVIIGSGRYRGVGEIPPSPVPVSFRHIGSPAAANLAVGSLSTRLLNGERIAFAQVSNYGSAGTPATAEFWADGKLINVERQQIEAGESHAFSWRVPPGAGTLEVRLPAPDALALDNRAWALPGGQQRSRILLVSEGNPFLLRALNLIPGATVTTLAPKDFSASASTYDLYVLDRVAPPAEAKGRLLLIDPPAPGVAEEFIGKIVANAGDPLLKFVDASEVHINLAHRHEAPLNGRVLWEGESAAGKIPLLWTEGNDRVVFSFALQQSDLPLRIAFPILMQNLAGWLLPPAPVDAPAVQPGESVALRPWPTATKLTVTAPGGTKQSWDVTTGMTPPFIEVGQPGIYQVAQAVGGGSRDSQFAANLFSALVSDLSPVAELNVPVLPEAKPVTSKAPMDLWRYLGWAALAIIGLEWWVYRRGY